MIVFCVDVSGSMCSNVNSDGIAVSVPIERGYTFSNSFDSEIRRSLVSNGKMEKVVNPSRLQCVQSAILSQLSYLASTHPGTRVVVVTFGAEITVITDHGRQVFTVFFVCLGRGKNRGLRSGSTEGR